MPSLDTYGVDVAIDATGDLAATQSGALALVGDVANCAQAIVLRTRTALGDLPLHPEYGSGVPELVGSKQTSTSLAMTLNTELQTLVEEDPRFVTAQVSEIRAPFGALVDTSFAQITAELIGGEAVTLANATDPASYDLSSASPSIDAAVDPTVTFGPLVDQEVFAQDTLESSQLADLNAQAFLTQNGA